MTEWRTARRYTPVVMTPSLQPLRVLLIDDAQADLTLLRHAFEAQPHPTELLTASGGHAALDLLREGTPVDLIVLDLNMPGMDGFEVLDALKADAESQLIPVLVLTISTDDDEVVRAYMAHANAVMVKPARFDDLQRLVGALLAYWQQVRFVRERDRHQHMHP